MLLCVPEDSVHSTAEVWESAGRRAAAVLSVAVQPTPPHPLLSAPGSAVPLPPAHTTLELDKQNSQASTVKSEYNE